MAESDGVEYDSEVVLSCSDLSLSRKTAGEPVRVVDGVTLSLRRGQSLAIMGQVGGGKSTLLAALATEAPPGVRVSGGDALVVGGSIRRRRARIGIRAQIGYVPQAAGASLPSRLTVAEVVAEPVLSSSRRVNRSALDIRVAGLLDELSLPIGVGEKFPFELSAGIRQRVAIARALVKEPRLLLADEPFANVDIDVRGAVSRALLSRRDDYGLATVLVTHEASVIAEFMSELVVLRSGHVVAQGRGPDELTWTPGHPAEQRRLILS